MFVKRKDWEQLNRKVKALENAVKAISERSVANSFYFGMHLTLQDYEDYSDYIKLNGLNGYPKTSVIPLKKSVDELAREVINGKWSVGAERKALLTAAGYSYEAVQKRVNELLYPPRKTIAEVAEEVVAGKWGAGLERFRRLTEAGYDYYAVQRRVNQILYK